jgi:hypothetical protein
MPYCEDCGTKLDGGICPNCHEELWIFDNQMTPDGYDEPLSEEFAKKVNDQREQVRKAGRK